MMRHDVLPTSEAESRRRHPSNRTRCDNCDGTGHIFDSWGYVGRCAVCNPNGER